MPNDVAEDPVVAAVPLPTRHLNPRVRSNPVSQGVGVDLFQQGRTASLPPATVASPCNCHALRQAVRRVTQLYDHALAPTGLRVTQFSLLAHLRDSGPITLKALAGLLVMDRATIGHNLRPLEAQGLIALTVGPDRRSRLVQLTEDGMARLRAARPLWKQAQTRFETAYGTEASSALRETMVNIAHTDFGVPA